MDERNQAALIITRFYRQRQAKCFNPAEYWRHSFSAWRLCYLGFPLFEAEIDEIPTEHYFVQNFRTCARNVIEEQKNLMQLMHKENSDREAAMFPCSKKKIFQLNVDMLYKRVMRYWRSLYRNFGRYDKNERPHLLWIHAKRMFQINMEHAIREGNPAPSMHYCKVLDFCPAGPAERGDLWVHYQRIIQKIDYENDELCDLDGEYNQVKGTPEEQVWRQKNQERYNHLYDNRNQRQDRRTKLLEKCNKCD